MTDEEKQYKGRKLFDCDLEKMSKRVEVLDLFCQATALLSGDKHVECSLGVLPRLLSSLKKQMSVNEEDL